MTTTSVPVASARVELPRTLGLFGLVVYGVGDMLGSGIYALVGKVAGTMGSAVWLAFLASMAAAAATALTYASVGSRYPNAGGAATVVHRAFGRPFLSYLVGMAILASGLTSFATQANAFSGYFAGIAPSVPRAAVMLAFVGALSLVNLRGLRESTWLNALCTLVEVGGLVVVVWVGARFLGTVDYLQVPAASHGEGLSLGLALQGGMLAFYAFVGFEDMINVAEEVRDAPRIFPRGVVIAVFVTAVLYVLISLVAVSVLPPAELAASGQPLVDVVRRAAPGFPPAVFSVIALFAIANTALLNAIMGSRLVFGMARAGLLPRGLAALHPTRGTPHRAIAIVAVAVGLLMFAGGVRLLASATSLLLLTVFALMNAALLVLQRRPGEPHGQFEIPAAIPAFGILVCVALLAQAEAGPAAIAAGLVAGLAPFWRVLRPAPVAPGT